MSSICLDDPLDQPGTSRYARRRPPPVDTFRCRWGPPP